MIKHYCDLCGKEITDMKHDLFPLEEQDFPDSTYADSSRFFGRELCRDCYYKRLAKHIKLDLELFGELAEVEE